MPTYITTTNDNGNDTTTTTGLSTGLFQHQQPSLLTRAAFAARDPGAAYFRAHLLLWLATTALLVADRLRWNVWPRQDVGWICHGGGGGSVDAGENGSGGCGQDFFCEVDEVCGGVRAQVRSAGQYHVVVSSSENKRNGGRGGAGRGVNESRRTLPA